MSTKVTMVRCSHCGFRDNEEDLKVACHRCGKPYDGANFSRLISVPADFELWGVGLNGRLIKKAHALLGGLISVESESKQKYNILNVNVMPVFQATYEITK